MPPFPPAGSVVEREVALISTGSGRRETVRQAEGTAGGIKSKCGTEKRDGWMERWGKQSRGDGEGVKAWQSCSSWDGSSAGLGYSEKPSALSDASNEQKTNSHCSSALFYQNCKAKRHPERENNVQFKAAFLDAKRCWTCQWFIEMRANK